MKGTHIKGRKRFPLIWVGTPVFLVMILLAACVQDQIAGIIGGPPPTPSETTTPLHRSSSATTQTTRATPTNSPTPEPLSAEDLLRNAISLQEEAEFYHFEMEMDISRELENVEMKFSGDFAIPEKKGGLFTLKFGGLTAEMEMIISGTDFYITDPASGEWVYLSEEMAGPAVFDLTGMWQSESFQMQDFTSITYLGLDTVEDRGYHHIRGVVPGKLMCDEKTVVENDVQIDYLIGADDGYIYQAEMTFDMIARFSGERSQTSMTTSFSNYNKPVLIVIPELPAEAEEREEQIAAANDEAAGSDGPLHPVEYGFTYELPGWVSLDLPDGWSSIRSREPGLIALSSKDVDFPCFDLEEGGALLQMYSTNYPKQSPLQLLWGEYLPSLTYEWEMVQEPQLIEINGQEAATVTYDSYGIFVEQATAVQSPDGSRIIVLLAVAREDELAAFGPVFERIRESISVSPVQPAPILRPQEKLSGEYVRYSDDGHAYAFSYPSTWQQCDDLDMLILTPEDAGPPGTSDSLVGSILIYPPQMLSGPSSGQETTARGLIYELWTTGGWMTMDDAIVVSAICQTEHEGAEYAAVYFAATDEESGGDPLYGFIGAVTDGQTAVGMVSWVEDPTAFDEVWRNILSSISIGSKHELERRCAATAAPGTI